MSRLQDMFPKSVSFGDLHRVHGLGVVPIINENAPEILSLKTLEEALAGGAVRVTETSETGEVPFLLLENKGDQPLIILDGEELWGGKQNRIVNTTLIIMAETTVKIPVSCIQAGRWRQDRADFEAAGSLFGAKSRALHKATVTVNVRQSGNYRSDQQAVWNEVSASLQDLGVSSATADFREGRERVSHRIEDFVQAIRPADNQIGSVFLSREGVLGLEMVATPALFAKVCDKITRSFAFEVLTARDLDGASGDVAKEWCEKIMECPFTKHQSPAAGEDIRLDSERIIGSGLLWNEALVHFSCFPDVRGRKAKAWKEILCRSKSQNDTSFFHR